MSSNCISTIEDKNCYEIVIKDSFGDGMLNPGYYSIIWNNNTLIKTNDFEFYISYYVENGSIVDYCSYGTIYLN